MGQIADVFIIMAQLDGKPTAFLVERDNPNLTIKPMKGLLGCRASMITELTLEDCRIPADSIIGAPGTGLSHIALTCLDYGRYTVAWGPLVRHKHVWRQVFITLEKESNSEDLLENTSSSRR